MFATYLDIEDMLLYFFGQLSVIQKTAWSKNGGMHFTGHDF